MTPSEYTSQSPQAQIALWLSRIFHPFIITIPTLILVTYLAGSSLSEAIKWTVISVGVVIIPVFLYIAFNVQSGRYSDWHVSIREQRRGLYLIGGLCLLLLLAVLILGKAPLAIQACLYAAITSNTIGALINRFLTKVSVHAAAMAGSTSALMAFSLPIGLALAMMTVVVGWARIWLNHHTVSQVILGWIIAAACIFIFFRLLL